MADRNMFMTFPTLFNFGERKGWDLHVHVGLLWLRHAETYVWLAEGSGTDRLEQPCVRSTRPTRQEQVLSTF